MIGFAVAGYVASAMLTVGIAGYYAERVPNWRDDVVIRMFAFGAAWPLTLPWMIGSIFGAASGTEAGTAETVEQGSVHEGPTAESGDAQTQPPSGRNPE